MMARTTRMSASPSLPGTKGALSFLMARASLSICRACWSVGSGGNRVPSLVVPYTPE